VGAVHGAIQHKRGGDAIGPQPTYESCGFPVTVWDLINQPFALRIPAIKTGHLGGRGGVINEGQSFRIKGRLCFPQASRAAATSSRSCSAARTVLALPPGSRALDPWPRSQLNDAGDHIKDEWNAACRSAWAGRSPFSSATR
jgi:hypothetical protein